MTAKLLVLLILAVFASEKNTYQENGPKHGKNCEIKEENSIVVKIEEDECAKVNKKSEYIGVSYHKNALKWQAQRRSKNENKQVFYGCYDDEETAAHASDTLAKKLMQSGEQNLKLNFPDDRTETHWKTKRNNKFIGVSYDKRSSKWNVQRWNKKKNKMIRYGCYNDEETAAHKSDILARKLMENSEQTHKFNFADDRTKKHCEKRTENKFIGVRYNENNSKWRALRWSKKENKMVYNGCQHDEETTAHASDNLARKLMENCEQERKLNFPDDYTEIYTEKKKTSKFIGVTYHKSSSKWRAQRWSKNHIRLISNGYHDDEVTAAHAYDTLARYLMENGEQIHRLNFPDDHTQVYSGEPREYQKTKRKRPKE